MKRRITNEILPFAAQTPLPGKLPQHYVLRNWADENDYNFVKAQLTRDFGLLPDLYHTATTSGDVIVAERERKVVGFGIIMYFAEHDGYPTILSVPWISVDVRNRNCGVATLLIRYIKVIASRLGVHRIDAARNPCLRTSFLSREGFKQRKGSPAFRDGYFVTWTAESHLPSPSSNVLQKRTKFLPLSVLRGEVRLRPAVEKDLKVWKSLVLQACAMEIEVEVIESTVTARLRLVAEDTQTNKIVGVVAANPSWVIILGCTPDHRNAGLGSLLLFCALDWCHRSQNAPMTSVSLTPLTPKAHRYYEKWGFKEDKSTKKADGYSTLTIELGDVPILPQGLRFQDIVQIC